MNLLVLLVFSFITSSMSTHWGRKAKPDEFPFMICIYDKKRNFCISSAALIKPKKAVTSASGLRAPSNWKSDIFEGELDQYAALGGVVDHENKTDDKMVDIINYEHHCYFKKSGEQFLNDVAIIELLTPFRHKSIKPARVIGNKDWYKLDWNDYITRNTKCSTIGWKPGYRQYDSGEKDLFVIETTPMKEFSCYLIYTDKKIQSAGYVCGNIKYGDCQIGFKGAILHCNGNVYGVRTEGKHSENVCDQGYYYLLSQSLEDLELLSPEQTKTKGAASISSVSLLSVLISMINVEFLNLFIEAFVAPRIKRF